jgi:hypothetical protein
VLRTQNLALNNRPFDTVIAGRNADGPTVATVPMSLAVTERLTQEIIEEPTMPMSFEAANPQFDLPLALPEQRSEPSVEARDAFFESLLMWESEPCVLGMNAVEVDGTAPNPAKMFQNCPFPILVSLCRYPDQRAVGFDDESFVVAQGESSHGIG